MRRDSIRVAMSELRPEQMRRAPRGILGAALLGAGAAVLCPAAMALAQETAGLRGEVAEADVNDDLLSRVPLLQKAHRRWSSGRRTRPPTTRAFPRRPTRRRARRDA